MESKIGLIVIGLIWLGFLIKYFIQKRKQGKTIHPYPGKEYQADKTVQSLLTDFAYLRNRVIEVESSVLYAQLIRNILMAYLEYSKLEVYMDMENPNWIELRPYRPIKEPDDVIDNIGIPVIKTNMKRSRKERNDNAQVL